jgi:hypothetical protein
MQGSTLQCDACGIGYSVGARGDYVVLRPSQKVVLNERRSPRNRTIGRARISVNALRRSFSNNALALGTRWDEFSDHRRIPKGAIVFVLVTALIAGALLPLATR